MVQPVALFLSGPMASAVFLQLVGIVPDMNGWSKRDLRPQPEILLISKGTKSSIENSIPLRGLRGVRVKLRISQRAVS